MSLKFGTVLDEKTPYQDEAGSSAIWRRLGYFFQASIEHIKKDKMKVSVYDYNSVMAHSFIGDVHMDISELLESNEEERELRADITDAKGRKTGKVCITLKLEKPLEESELDPMIPAGTEEREKEVAFHVRSHLFYLPANHQHMCFTCTYAGGRNYEGNQNTQ